MQGIATSTNSPRGLTKLRRAAVVSQASDIPAVLY